MSNTVQRIALPRRDPRLDRLIVHDEESRDFAYKSATPGERVSTKHKSFIGILNQRRLGGCTGFAGTKCVSHDPYYNSFRSQIAKGHYSENEQFARHLYSDATRADSYPGQWPPTDTGSSGLAVGKVFLDRGDITSYTHAFSTDDALDALVQAPWIMGIKWYNDMFTPDKDGFVYPTGDLAGGHELCADEINVEDEYIELPQSWGPDWGLKGRFRIKFDVLDTLLQDDGDVTIFTQLAT